MGAHSPQGSPARCRHDARLTGLRCSGKWAYALLVLFLLFFSKSGLLRSGFFFFEYMILSFPLKIHFFEFFHFICCFVPQILSKVMKILIVVLLLLSLSELTGPVNLEPSPCCRVLVIQGDFLGLQGCGYSISLSFSRLLWYI
jgi:hypothetical protein